MSYNTSKDTITVNDVTYDLNRDEVSRGMESYTELMIEEFPGLVGRLGYEQSGEGFNPREWGNIGTMSVSYRGYNLGDEDISKIDFEIQCPQCEGDGEIVYSDADTTDADEATVTDETCPNCQGSGEIDVNPVDFFKRQRGARVVLGLTVYEHSGITMRAGNVTLPWDTDRWDTSFVGFIYDTPEKWEGTDSSDYSDEQIEAILRREVEVYAAYLEGDITYYSVDDEETGYADSCGGYVGSHEHCEQECFESMETAIEKRLAEMVERQHMAARDIETA